MRLGIITSVLMSGLLAACTSVSSKQVALDGSRSPSGIHYSAPKALFSVELVSAGDDIVVAISEPFLVGDPDATFSLRASSGTFADQKYNFNVDPGTRLLSTIRSDSLGQGDNILVDLAKAAGGVSGSEESGIVGGDARAEREGAVATSVLFHRIIDPMMFENCGFAKQCRLTKLEQDLFVAAKGALDCGNTTPADSRTCRAIDAGEDMFTIELTPLFSKSASSGVDKKNRCRGSVCYRAPVPYEMRLRVFGVTDISQIVQLPNKAPAMGLDLPAGMFADAKSYVGLLDGMPVQVRTDRDNELAAVAAVPLNVINGFFNSAANVARLRINYNNERVRGIKSEIALDEAQRKRRDAQNDDADSDSLEGDLPDGNDESGETVDSGFQQNVGNMEDLGQGELPRAVQSVASRVNKRKKLFSVTLPTN